MGVNLPNLITFGRLLLVPLTVYFILIGELGWAFLLFVLAGVSDALDGILARLLDARTHLGAFLDPLADKVLLVSVYLSLGQIGYLPLWLVILVVSRDLMIVGGVLLFHTLRQPLAMRPLAVSKINTLMQIALAALVLAAHGIDPEVSPILLGRPLTAWLTGLVAATTLLSGAAYVMHSRHLFDDPGAAP